MCAYGDGSNDEIAFGLGRNVRLGGIIPDVAVRASFRFQDGEAHTDNQYMNRREAPMVHSNAERTVTGERCLSAHRYFNSGSETLLGASQPLKPLEMQSQQPLQQFNLCPKPPQTGGVGPSEGNVDGSRKSSLLLSQQPRQLLNISLLPEPQRHGPVEARIDPLGKGQREAAMQVSCNRTKNV